MSGLDNEIQISRTFHSEGIPLLVSPVLLRHRQMGQIDLARLRKDRAGWLIEMGEVKSSEIGEEVMGQGQKKRLRSSQHFLSALLGHPTRLISLIR